MPSARFRSLAKGARCLAISAAISASGLIDVREDRDQPEAEAFDLLARTSRSRRETNLPCEPVETSSVLPTLTTSGSASCVWPVRMTSMPLTIARHLAIDVEAVVGEDDDELRALGPHLVDLLLHVLVADAERPLRHHPARIGDRRERKCLADHGDLHAARARTSCRRGRPDPRTRCRGCSERGTGTAACRRSP